MVPGYYLPMIHVHNTVDAMLSRLENTPDGGMGFNSDSQPKQADEALKTAHNIVLSVLELQQNHFKPEPLREPLQACLRDFIDIWGKPSRSSGETPNNSPNESS
jgi:hypothetical protein